MKRFIVISVISLCVFSLGSSINFAKSDEESRFPDMNGHWALKYVEALAGKGIIKGMDDGLFHPDSPVTTAQFTTMVIRGALGDIEPTTAYWASGYISKAMELGIIDSNDSSSANNPLIRRFVARICNDALDKIFHEPPEEDVAAADRLQDLYTCHSCVNNIQQVFVKGIMIGKPDNNFYGDETLTRAEAAIVIMKMLDPTMREPQTSLITLPVPQENGAISFDEALALLAVDKAAMLIDVRSLEEHNKGYINGSICIPLPDIQSQPDAVAEDKATVIILYCQKGSRTLQAYKILKEAGYTNLYTMGGIDDWPYDVYSVD